MGVHTENDTGVDVRKLHDDLDDVVSQDCPSCGEIAIRIIEEPFIPEEKLMDYIQSWSLGKGLFTENDDFGLREGEDAFSGAADAGGVDDTFDGNLDDFNPLADL